MRMLPLGLAPRPPRCRIPDYLHLACGCRWSRFWFRHLRFRRRRSVNWLRQLRRGFSQNTKGFGFGHGRLRSCEFQCRLPNGRAAYGFTEHLLVTSDYGDALPAPGCRDVEQFLLHPVAGDDYGIYRLALTAMCCHPDDRARNRTCAARSGFSFIRRNHASALEPE